MTVSTVSPTLTTAVIAAEARAFARDNGIPVGTRGRLSQEAFVSYFLSRPQRARQVAKAAGLPVSLRGRISRQTVEQVAEFVR